MAGGTWLSQNKTRPGAYINFKAVPKSKMTVGDRGIVAIGLPLSWGKSNELIEVLSSEMLDGKSKAKVGFDVYYSDSKLLASALNYCYKALVYRMDAGGVKATATLGNLVATAKYAGTFGNKILVSVVENTNGTFNVITYVDGAVIDNQNVTEISELDSSDYVDFTGSGELVANAGTALVDGTDGTVDESTAYPAMFALLKMARWQVLACTSSDTAIKSSVQTFINGMRNDEGRYVQGVVADYSGADSEGIINSISGAIIDEVTFTKEEFTAIVAGMSAGANVNESNTAREITGATKIIGELDDAGIKDALKNGKFVLSTSASGKIKVEQDINSLHTYSSDRNYNFSKNRVIRALDEIGTSTEITWEDSYMGKVDNNDTGRSIFKSDLVAYGNEMQRINAIQEFAGTDDITVAQGNDLDSVLVEWGVKPVDSMEKLYMTVNVRN